MKRIVYLIFLISLISQVNFAQPYDTLWTKLFHNEWMSIPAQAFGHAAVELSDGSIVAAGHCTDPFIKALIIKTDASGNEIWRKKYFDDIMKSFVCSDMKPTPDGGFVLFGYGQTGTILLQNGFRLLKLNADGDYEWDKFFPISYSADTVCAAERLVVAPDGGFVMVGSNAFYLGLKMVGYGVAMKADASGNLLWHNNYGESDRFDYFLGVENNYGPGFVMCGYTESGPDSIQGGDMLFVKTDDNGNQTDFVFHGTMNTFDEASTIRKSNDGGFIVGGAWGENGIQMSLIKLTESLNLSWVKEYGAGEDFQYGCAANTSTNGNYLLAGWHIYGPNPSKEHWFVVTDAGGNMIWDINYRTAGLYSEPHSVEPTSDGGFIICGTEETSEGVDALLLVRIGSGSTDIEDDRALNDYLLMQNYPNPFNPSTTITFTLPVTEHVKIRLFDILGNELSVLIDEQKPAGIHHVLLDASNLGGKSELTSGVYLYKIEAGNFSDAKKIVLLK